MKIEENKSATWFKILDRSGLPIDGSKELWSLPIGQSKGEKLDFHDIPARYYTEGQWKNVQGICGSWLVSNPAIHLRGNMSRQAFVAELISSPTYELNGIIWITHLRLVREATGLDLKRFGIYRSFGQMIDNND